MKTELLNLLTIENNKMKNVSYYNEQVEMLKWNESRWGNIVEFSKKIDGIFSHIEIKHENGTVVKW